LSYLAFDIAFESLISKKSLHIKEDKAAFETVNTIYVPEQKIAIFNFFFDTFLSITLESS
jgi:hypothetical protein